MLFKKMKKLTVYDIWMTDDVLINHLPDVSIIKNNNAFF